MNVKQWKSLTKYEMSPRASK